MYERFTGRSRKVMTLASQNARRFKHELVGSELILLGLLLDGNGVGIAVLKNLKVDLVILQNETEKHIKIGIDEVSGGKLPLSMASRKVIENSIDACRELGDRDVGTQHLLLGLVREKSIAAEILNQFGVTDEKVCAEIRNLIGDNTKNEDMFKEIRPQASERGGFERFTDRARMVMALANQEAKRL